jgi:acetoacetate decarboxylase
MTWSRRHLLGAGLAGAGWLTVGGIPSSALDDDDLGAQDLAGKTLNLVLRYRTDPERIARVLPPALEPDEVAEVTIDWWLHYPDRGGENLFYPGPYTESGIHVTARWQGQRGMFQIGMPLDQDWGRVAGRENVGLIKKDGVPRLSRQGRRVHADLTRRGKLLYRIETEVLDSPAHPMLWHRETGFGAFLYRYRLDPDWRRGPLGPDPVELWLRVLGGKRGFYPQEMVEGAPRECDLDRTRFAMVEPSPLDPFAEFPLHAIVAVSYRETGLYPQADRVHREAKTETRIERLQMIDPRRFEPWAFYMYDRPITAGRAWTPVGWPKEQTAMKLAPDELDRYRRRDALALELRDVVQVDLRAIAELHARMLPPGLEAGPEPVLRMLALDVPISDFSTQPFHELWLLARCLREGREAWYALSHLVGPDGDVVFGRETFGYPSRMAAIEWSRDAESFAIAATRLGRRVVSLAFAAGGVGLSEEGTHHAVELVGLRLHPPYRAMTENGFVEPGPRADLVAQPWTFEYVSTTAWQLRRHLELDIPADAGPGRIGKPDPWYELAGAEVIKVMTGRGSLRRGPGVTLGKLENYWPYYAERFDGTLAAGEAISGEARHTFLAG